MSRIKSSKTIFKSQAQPKIIEGQLEEKKPNRENTPIKPASNNTSKFSFFNLGSAISTDLKKEPLGAYYEERKKILFGDIDVNKEQFYISQFLLNSQKKINGEYSKMIKSSGSSFFSDTPQKAHNFTLGVKENIANFCLIIRLYLLYNNTQRAYEIFLLMCKQNKKILDYIYHKLFVYCNKKSSAMITYAPHISKKLIQILSCIIKLSGKFSKITFQNSFSVFYLRIIYILRFRNLDKISQPSIKNEIRYSRLYLYSSCLFDLSIFSFFKYQPLGFSTYLLQHIKTLYQDKSPKDYTKYEQLLFLKINYNLGLFYYVDGLNNEAINNLVSAKEKLSQINFIPFNKYEENDYFETAWRNSAVLKNNDKNILNKLTFYKNKINNLDEKTIETKISNQISKHSFNQNKNLRVIKEEGNFEIPKKQSLYDPRNSTGLFLGLSKIELRQPLFFEHIKKKISIEIELLLSQIELNKKNYRGALEHINCILCNQKTKDDFEADVFSRKKTFNIINKTYKNLKSFQGIKIKKMNINNFGKDKESENKNKEPNNNNEDNSNNYVNDETIMTEEYIKFIKLLLDKIDHDYNKSSQVEQSNNQLMEDNNNEGDTSFDKFKNLSYSSFKEMEKFFIFICSLSIFQLKILNESQPNIYSKRSDLPIIFSNQFQDCLTLSQRLALTQLQTMSLSRHIILIDSDKDISPENLDYKYMKYKIKTSKNSIKENEEENLFKFIAENKGKTINSRKSNDSLAMNSMSTNNNYTLSVKRGKKEREFEIEDENNMFDILLIKIKNENNKNFIESHKKCILQILNSLSSDEKKLFQNSPNLLKKMLKNIEIKIKNNNKNDISDFTSSMGKTSLSFISISSSQELSSK